MKVVYKYEIPFNDHPSISLPKGAQIISFGAQGGPKDLYLWAIIDPEGSEFEDRHLRLAGTGHPIHEDGLEHIGSIQVGALVWHLFEVCR